MSSPRCHQPSPAPLAPPQADAGRRLLNRWRDVWRALGTVRPAGSLWPWYDANRDDQSGRTRCYERAVETLVNANRAAAGTPHAAPVREATEAFVAEVVAQCHAVNPADAHAPGLVECVTDHIEQAAALHREVMAALADGRVTAAELDAIRQRLARTNATGGFLARRVDADLAKLVRGAA